MVTPRVSPNLVFDDIIKVAKGATREFLADVGAQAQARIKQWRSDLRAQVGQQGSLDVSKAKLKLLQNLEVGKCEPEPRSSH